MGKFIKGLFFGAVVGATAGLLLAPKSGKKMREDLSDSLEDAADTTQQLTNSLQNFQGALMNLRVTASAILPDLTKDSKQMMSDFKFQAEPRVIQIHEQIAKINENLEKNLPK